MKLCILFFLWISAVCFAQKNSSTAYRPYTINEKNLAKIPKITTDSLFQYSLLIKEQDLKNELTDYFKTVTDLSETIKKVEIIIQNNRYFLKSIYDNQSVLLTLLHLTEIPGIDAYFLILGSSNCLTPASYGLCFPSINHFDTEIPDKLCECFTSKKD